MSRVYEKDLIPSLSREMGDTGATSYYSNDQLFSAINDGLDDFNEEGLQQYTVVGSASTAYFSPDPSSVDKRLIILYSALALTRGEIQKSARTALSHSNPAGRTDLTRIAEMLAKQADRLESKIEGILRDRNRAAIETEAEETDTAWGEELKGRPTESAEGLGITIIEKTV